MDAKGPGVDFSSRRDSDYFLKDNFLIIYITLIIAEPYARFFYLFFDRMKKRFYNTGFISLRRN